MRCVRFVSSVLLIALVYLVGKIAYAQRPSPPLPDGGHSESVSGATKPTPTPPNERSSLALQPIMRRPVIVPTVPLTAPSGIQSTDVLSLNVLPAPVPEVRLPNSVINIALLGGDSRHRGSGNTDVIIIASIYPDIPVVTLLSIPRDTLVYIPGHRMAKLNTAFRRGVEAFRQTMRYNFGLRIDAYVLVNFTGLVRTVDLLGGIELVATCPLHQVFPRDPFYVADPEQPNVVTRPYTDTFTGEVWEVGGAVPTMTISLPSPGVYKLNGLQALAYVRARYGVRGGDMDRGRRMQQVLRAMLDKGRVNGLLSLTLIPQLFQQLDRYIETDLSLSQILWLAQIANRLDESALRSRYFDAVGLTGITLPEVGAVLVPDRQRITPFLTQALTVSLNQSSEEGVTVEVWNGHARPGFERVAVERMRELGLRVISVKQADRVYTETQVVDFTVTRKGSILPLLKRTIGLKDANVRAEPKPDGPRYRIIVGNDFVSCYRDSYTFLKQSISLSSGAPITSPMEQQ